jgi:peroxiredoxin Q/BCP
MSKKTRAKSSSPASRKAARAQSGRTTKAAQKRARAKTVSKPARKATKQTGNAASEASHKPPLKQPKKAGASVARKSALTEGAKAPAFRLPRDGGSTVALSDFAGRKLVLFFYPRANTPGCTREAIDFTRLTSAFAESRTAVLGVSADPPKAQEAFRDKHRLSTPLASDEPHEMLEAYGVWGEKSMYGKTFHGILRTTVLIDAEGRVLKIWRNVKVDGHADDVLATVRLME